MNYQNLKFAQISILTAVSIYAASPVLFITTAGLALWNSSRYYITAILGPLCALAPFLPQLQALQLQYLLPCLAMLLLCVLERRQMWEHGLSREQKTTIFLIFLGLTTLNGTTLTSRLQLTIFYLLLVFKVLHIPRAVSAIVTALRVFLVLEAAMVSLIAWFLASWGAEEIANRSWWYFAAFPLAILYSSLLQSKDGILRASQSQLTSESKEIEMQDLSQKSLSNRDEPEAEGAQMEVKLGNEQIQKNKEEAHAESNIQESQQTVDEFQGEQSQSQSLNLFLVIPFCLLQQGWIEIPIYAYLIALAWGSSRRWLLSLVLVSAAIISANCQVTIEVDAALRVLAVLLVTKNLQGGYEIGEILKIIWLRSSFALVLSVLFWFALLTVNIFHLLFIAIILLFITKGAAEKTQQIHSFRHRNWKYLLALFNLFLLLRLLLTILSGGSWKVQENWKEVLQLTGISFHYVASPDLFNAVPLLINAIMGLQFLTYNSKIYSKHTQSTLFENYRVILANGIDVLTVIYYKLLPWVSYLAIICLLLILEPSLGGCILLAWILLTLGTHVLLKNEPSTYRRLFWLWIFYSRLTSLQIVLRYVFQFMKFDLLAFVRNVRIFQVLLQYQEILGLAIRDQDTVYLKTVTKFQLMISLDLMAIFIAFLVTEYYSLLLKYSELPPAPQWGTEERRVEQLYHNYVDFKLTAWLQGRQVYKAIRIFCNSFFELYFPLLGLACCRHITLLNFLYLCLLLRYFLALNYAYYRSYVLSRFGWAVLAIVLNWSRQKPTLQLQDLNSRLRGVGQEMAACKVDKHNSLRLGFVVVTVTAVLLTYFSGMLRDIEVLSLVEGETVLRMRWWLLVSGCSKECGLVGHFPKLMLVLLVLEMKCCWFVNKFQLAARNYPENQAEDAIVHEVLTIGEGIQDEDRNESAYLHEMEGHEIQSSILGEAPSQKEVGEMQVSLLLGSLKLLERSLVMVLVFISIVLGSHPFGIVYLLCAICLNYLGSVSVNVLSKALSVLLLLEYMLCLSNYSDPHLFPPASPEFAIFQQETVLHWLLRLPAEWEWYVTFGKGEREMAMLWLSWGLLAGYQLYFVALRKAWLMILSLVEVEAHVGRIGRRMEEHLRQVYEYGLTYSPLVVMLLCLFIYLLDYTTTNMLLTALTVGFIFVSFLVRQYRESRHFWRTYFVVLQLLIVCFMLIYSLLQLPMLAAFCTRLLCAPEELHTQIYKALLLLILQIGLDLTSSHHFDRALRQFDHHARRLDLQKLALAYHHNDRKIMETFKSINKQRDLTNTVERVERFLRECKENPQLEFERKEQAGDASESWYDFILEFLPSLIDEHLLLSEHGAARIVAEENATWIRLKDIKELTSSITDLYIDDYAELEGDELEEELRVAIANSQEQASLKEIELQELQRGEQGEDERDFSSRKSFAEESLRGVSSHAMVESMRRSAMDEKENKQLLYLLLVESVLSNWHYLTYFALVQLHVSNQGLLTLPLPAVVFCFGVVASYQAGKQIWRALLLLVLLPLLFKFAVSVSLLEPSQSLVYLLVGDNMESVFWEYVCIVLIIGQCVILKMVGHYAETAEEVECMKMALVRNLLNHRRPEEREQLFKLLRGSSAMPVSLWDMLFGKSEGKPGYDYSTLLTGLQLLVLVWVFLFYDRMAVREQVTFYQMIEYNQFSSGMVALTLCQLFFLLVERFVAIVDLRAVSPRWECALVIKYVLLVLNLLLVEGVVLVYFPLSSGQFAGNGYVTTLLVLNMLALLVQALQIKQGLDQASRGFMDRYTWYNGFIYIGFRAVPFLFEFKAFSDWTFTRTALRIFDWIRLEEIFGRLYVAKCNALFLAGKQLGSKIEWWKKLLMGYPLLLSIILLLFGPLVLFSSLNPLASRNDVTAGYLEVILRINKTNEYPLYTNSHITDIHRLSPSAEEQRLLSLYDIDPDTVQQLQLEEFSDQYWEISEGSYYKLLAEPEDSLYELLVRAKFDRNETGLSSLYVLNTYELPAEKVPGFKQTLLGKADFCATGLLPTFLRLDNNNGLHELGDESADACLKCTAGVRATKQYWVLQGGLRLRVASDKFTKAIFGYSVMSFYISIILVIANYFRFLFQGTVHTIITSDIPHPDPALALCNAIFTARRDHDLKREEELFWNLIDLLRSPDTLKALTGNYLQARLDTLKKEEQKSMKND